MSEANEEVTEEMTEEVPEEVPEEVTEEGNDCFDLEDFFVATTSSTTSETTSSTGHTVATITSEEFMLKVKNCAEPRIGDYIYPMKSNPRGYCLIFNVFEFPNTEYNIRRGSEAEAKRLAEIFEQLHFTVDLMNNPTKNKIESTVYDYSQNSELEGHDAIVIIVLSHGESDGVIGTDGLIVHFRDIVEMLNNKNCPNLINKPKIFFFSCCRGNTWDFGVKQSISLQSLDINRVNSDTVVVPEADGARPIAVSLVPTASDILICYSTVDGYVSYRCEQMGTWLGQELAKTLIKYSHNTSLLELLTKISYAINKRISSSTPEAKQVIEIILRGFTKGFYFNPGYFADPVANGTQAQ